VSAVSSQPRREAKPLAPGFHFYAPRHAREIDTETARTRNRFAPDLQASKYF